MIDQDEGSVLVTGAFGAIGSATAHLFRETGWVVLGLDRDPSITGNNAAGFHGVQVDLTDEASVEKALGSLADLPPLRHVVAVAGGALPDEPTTQDDLAKVSVDTFRRSLDQNLTSQFLTVKACLPWLRKTPDLDRSVTLTSSFNALSGYGMAAYSAAKAGLIGMMHALTPNLGAEGIRINVVAPGTVKTPRTESIWSHVPDHFDRLATSAALGRLGEPVDIARVYRALAIEMSHVTGQVLVVDGGQLIKR